MNKKYRVLKTINIFNTRWGIGNIIDDYEIDKIFSDTTKNFLVTDNWIEEIQESNYQKIESEDNNG